MAKKSRQKRLNIGNTDRHYNVNLMQRSDIESKTKVTRLNEKEIEENMDILAEKSTRYPLRDGNEYIIYQEKYTNDTLISKMTKHAGQITYYTDTIVPYYIIKQLAGSPESEAVYMARPKFTPKEAENIELCSMATNVVIDVPVVIPDTNPYDLLFALHPLKTHVEKVQLSFPPLEKSMVREEHKKYYREVDGRYHVHPKYQFEYFKHLQNSLSIWKMNLWIVCENDYQYTKVKSYIEKEKNKRYPARSKTGDKK